MLTLRDGCGFAVDARGWGFDCANAGVTPDGANKAITRNAGARHRIILAALIGRGPGRVESRVG